ncbi:FTR1 family protein [Conexibacter sp. JD483]|uniref:FTR1 family iron permease n=1 Tax=unclassified Conexibacter TaxID=2627773 RepID=UPI0027164EA9|nr:MULTISPECIES: FTR1 family protein [unclassified Conexibacter]MDO8185187.1 FTR1 family protein [Conexibacter sp. CPCC 205706]MDO8198233.1 FTR1 family protein [Conexibacter sp. CPCC 205762]MDR9367805.1 FTR1 family protein [Conexibacter sp. JD483]
MTRRPLPFLLTLLATLLLCGGGALAGPAGAATGDQPWRVVDDVRGELFEAQTALILETPADAVRAVRRARQRYDGALSRTVAAADPDADRAIDAAFGDALRAAAADDEIALAAARGEIRAALFAGSYAVTVDAVQDGDARTARSWLLLREFRTATRFTRPGGDATLAVRQLARRRIAPDAARAIVVKDLLDAYQGRLRELLDDAARGDERALPNRTAEASAQAAGYFGILLPRYLQDMGDVRADRALAAYNRMQRAARRGDSAAFRAAHADAVAALEGFTAAPFTDEEAARRAQQLLRFLALVPVEYGRGTNDGSVTKDFEIEEAVAFQKGADAAFQDLQAMLAKRDPARTATVADQLDRLGGLVDEATKRKEGVAPSGDVEQLAGEIEDGLTATMPSAWQEATDESDYDLIALTLDRMEAAAGAGQYQQAEQARLEAYAFFEFGPERRLKAFDPGLALDVEGLIWFGALDQEGLATLIADRASRRDIHATRLVLDERLGDAAATLGDSANKTQVVVNSAILVFREGLEAVLILAAITASFIGAKRRMRRPVLIGAGLGLLASVITWVLAQTILTSLDQYGEKLEAVVGIIAIAVLLLITNWFFHKVYWSEWIGKFHRQRKRLERFDRVGFISAQVIGLVLLGLTSVYREGFETVLFLQSLQLSAGTATVVEGAGLGLAMVLGVAVLTFALQRKLPYKKMLIVTGVMIGFVLIVMVGQTARTMQGTGWLPITPLGFDPPYWASLWFGVYPTVETVVAQLAAAAFVIGSYYLAQEVRVKRPQRAARKRRAAAAAETPQPAEAEAREADAQAATSDAR